MNRRSTPEANLGDSTPSESASSRLPTFLTSRRSLLLFIPFVMTGVVSGLAVTALAILLDMASSSYAALVGMYSWAAFILLPLGLPLIVFLCDLLAPRVSGSGLPAIKALLHDLASPNPSSSHIGDNRGKHNNATISSSSSGSGGRGGGGGLYTPSSMPTTSSTIQSPLPPPTQTSNPSNKALDLEQLRLSAVMTAGTAPGGAAATAAANVFFSSNGEEEEAIDHASIFSEVLGLKALILRLFLTVATAAVGGTLGREGPSVQVAACATVVVWGLLSRLFPGLMQTATTLLGGRRKTLILLTFIGGACGMASAFTAPIAGIVFAIEELTNDFSAHSGLASMSAVAASTLAVATLLPFRNWFQGYAMFPLTSAASAAEFTAVVVVTGVVGGLLGGLYSWSYIRVSRLRGALLASVRQHRPHSPGTLTAYRCAMASVCGVVVAGLQQANPGPFVISGGDKSQAQVLVLTTGSGVYTHMPWQYPLCLGLASWLTFMSGAPGGVIAPALATGSAWGYFLSKSFSPEASNMCVAATAVAYTSAVTQAPFSVMSIVLMMVNADIDCAAFMGAAVVGTLMSKMFCLTPLYDALELERVRPTRATPLLRAAGVPVDYFGRAIVATAKQREKDASIRVVVGDGVEGGGHGRRRALYEDNRIFNVEGIAVRSTTDTQTGL
eukprot:UC1_evm1s1629